MSRATILHGDCIEVMATMEPNSVDAIVCDPPYGLEFMGKEWDKLGGPQWGRNDRRWEDRPKGGSDPFDSARPRYGKDSRAMQRWHEAWAIEAFRVLKPGGHLVAFSGTRTSHRMVCAIEDAGFEIRDSLVWMYGSGFPKSLDVGKAIDKAAGAEREVTGIKSDPRYQFSFANSTKGDGAGHKYGKFNGVEGADVGAITAPATPEAEHWQGWGTALKPAFEPVCWASKPYTPRGELDIIVANLCRLEAQLWSLLPASIASEHFFVSPAEYDEACGIARWSAEDRRNTLDGLFAQTDTSRFIEVMDTCLSTVWSWNCTLGELLTDTSTSTTETATGLTIDLTTLKSLLSPLTPRTIIQAEITPSGSTLNALPVARYFSAVEKNLTSTRELSALVSATSEDRTNSQGATGLTPNLEPICLARKPLTGTVASTVLAYGTGALNIDACRIDASADDIAARESRNGATARNTTGYMEGWTKRDELRTSISSGRWPANVLLDEDAAALLDEQSGERPGCKHPSTAKPESKFRPGQGNYQEQGPIYGDTGGASRFFYTAKASRSERNAGLDGMPDRDARAVYNQNCQQCEDCGRKHPNSVHHCVCGGVLSIVEVANPPRANHHPTVKPIALMRWLVRLVTPPGGVVLDPFTGSGSTGCAAALEGFDFIGIEQDAEYVEIARARIAHWTPKPKPQLALALEMIAGD